MDTSTLTFVCRHVRLGILTEHASDLVDLTDGLDALLIDSALNAGVVNVMSCQPGAGILVAADPWTACDDSAAGRVARLSVADGRLQLGAAARVYLVEHDGPAAREIAVVMAGATR